MYKSRFLALILVLLFYLSIPAAALNYQLSNGNNFVLGDLERIKETRVNTTVTFNSSDLLKDDGKADSIMVIELPDIDSGNLLVSKKQVNLFEEIPANKFSKMKFVPTSKTSTASFCYLVKKDGKFGDAVYRMTIKVADELKTTKIKAETQKNITIDCTIKSGAGAMLDIVKTPKLGTITIASSGRGVSYSPYENKTGNDSFVLNEINEKGDVVASHTVEVKINKPASTLKYEDMDGSYAAYAAIKLADSGVFTGSTVGGKMVFEPKKTVSRGDFLVMLMKSSKAELDAGSIGDTTFTDYDSMPKWLKNYVGTAVQAGVVAGRCDKAGNKLFEADANLTRAEAAVMVYNALKPQVDETDAITFADAASIPSWASQAIGALSACGIVNGYEDNTVRAMQPITREECATMLYSAIQYSDSTSDGLLGAFAILQK